jgi:Arc/MetJ-type ribon-helix-helix transcriptional regulator
MNLQLKPELQRFIDDQVRAGHFASVDAAIEAAVEQMMQASEVDDLDDDTAAAINRAEEQLDRVANMSIEIRPELQTFIEDQVKAGRFPSTRAAIDEAVEQMRLNLECSQLTQEDIKAIEESDAEIDRGEYVDFREFAARMRKKYCAE